MSNPFLSIFSKEDKTPGPEIQSIVNYYAVMATGFHVRETPLAGLDVHASQMDSRRQAKSQFGLEQRPENQVHRSGPLPDCPQKLGDPIAEDLRFVVKSIVGEENFIDMQPNRSNNYCCGGGGGFLQSGYNKQRLAYGRLKDQLIKATGADYCIAGCHNCHAQIHELSEHYGGISGGAFVDHDVSVTGHPGAQ